MRRTGTDMRPRREAKRAARRGAVAATARVGAAAACVVLALCGGVASAASTLPLLGSFGSEGSGAGQLVNARGVAVDASGGPSNGSVYVADLADQRVEKFGSVGNFLLTFGKGVNATKVKQAAEGKSVSEGEENVCTASSGDVCGAGTEGPGNGEFSFPLGVAVDPGSGDVYVEDFLNHRVAKYTSAGEFLLTFGGQVNKTTGGNVCTAAEVCQAGVTASSGEAGEGEFHEWGIGAFVAVGPSGTVYVGDENRVQEFKSSGVYQGQIELPGGHAVTALAVDSAANVYLKDEATASVHKFEPSGSSYVESATQFDQGSASVAGVAVDPAGDVSVLDFAAGYRVLRYDPAGALLAESAPGPIRESTGIAANGSGTTYVSDLEANNVLLFGSPPSEGNPPPAIDAEFASHVGAEGAVLGAEINPEFLAATYYVEYGTDSSYSNGKVPAPPGVALGAENLGDDSASVSLEGLRPGTTYHYRFVALSKAGSTPGVDRTFTTRQAGALALPDDRAFELVSPSEDNGAEVGLPPGGGETVLPLQATPEGGMIAYTSFTAFGEAHGAPAASQYIATRGSSGWSTQNITPPDREGQLRPPLRGFSPDLSTGVVIQREPTLAPGAVAGYENVYLRDDASGAVTALTTPTPRVSPGETYCAGYAGASADFSRVFFFATGALTENAPEGPERSLYEWSRAEGLKLVSVLEQGEPAQPNGGTGFGAGKGLGCVVGESIVYHAISADGSRVFWTYQPHGGEPELLVRENGARTIQLDASQGGSGNAGKGQFWAASADGTRVLFTDPEQLTENASSGSGKNLYEYNLETEKLTDLTPVPEGKQAEVGAVLGASNDGSYVYFVAAGVLAEGATPARPNLYVWHAGEGIRFIATLSSKQYSYLASNGNSESYGDSSDSSEEPRNRTVRVTPDGLHLAFESTESLKTVNFPQGYDSVDQATGEPDSEVYLYDYEGGRLICASCNPSGARPVGLASPAGLSSVPAWYVPYQQPRYLSDDGGRLFFDSFDALTVHDTNGKQNVYEWEREGLGSCVPSSPGFSESGGGCLFSISPGTSSDNSNFLEASTDGRDVFFSTRQPLVPPAEGERYEIYDARVGGGFPAPPPPPLACSESCRPASPTAPPLAPPSSEAFFGTGNLVAAPVTPATAAKSKPLTRAQKLAKALEACKTKPRKQRATCKKRARNRYGARAKAKKTAGRGER
jgi:hypothetical protein